MTTTRDRILDTAVEILRRHGAHGTTVQRIAASGVTVGSIYHAFPGGKDELLAAALARAGAAYRELFEAIVTEHDDIADGVAAFFDGAAAMLLETDFLDLCPIATVASEVASTNEALRRATADVFATWTAALADRLRAAGVDPVTATDLTAAVLAALEGSFVLARATRSPEPVRATGRVLTAAVRAALTTSTTTS